MNYSFTYNTELGIYETKVSEKGYIEAMKKSDKELRKNFARFELIDSQIE